MTEVPSAKLTSSYLLVKQTEIYWKRRQMCWKRVQNIADLRVLSSVIRMRCRAVLLTHQNSTWRLPICMWQHVLVSWQTELSVYCVLRAEATLHLVYHVKNAAKVATSFTMLQQIYVITELPNCNQFWTFQRLQAVSSAFNREFN